MKALSTRHLHVIHIPIPRIISTQVAQLATDLYNLASSEHRQQATKGPKGTPARRRGAEEYTSTADHFPRRLISTEESCSNKHVENRHTPRTVTLIDMLTDPRHRTHPEKGISTIAEHRVSPSAELLHHYATNTKGSRSPGGPFKRSLLRHIRLWNHGFTIWRSNTRP